MATLKAMKEAVIEAVAVLDESDGSRVSTAEAIDNAREALVAAYGVEFENDLEQYLDEIDGADGDDDTAEPEAKNPAIDEGWELC